MSFEQGLTTRDVLGINHDTVANGRKPVASPTEEELEPVPESEVSVGTPTEDDQEPEPETEDEPDQDETELFVPNGTEDEPESLSVVGNVQLPQLPRPAPPTVARV